MKRTANLQLTREQHNYLTGLIQAGLKASQTVGYLISIFKDKDDKPIITLRECLIVYGSIYNKLFNT